MAEVTLEDMNTRLEKLTTKLAANEEKEKADEKMEARLAAIKSAMNHMTDEEKMAMKKGVEDGTDDDMKSAMKKAMEDMPVKEKKEGNETENKEKTGTKENEEGMSGTENGEDKEKEAMKAKVKSLTAIVNEYQKGRSFEIIEKLATLKAKLIPDIDLDVYKTALKAKKFEALMTEFESRKDEIEAMSAAEKAPEKKHFGFGLTGSVSKPSGMTKVSDIMDGGIA